MARFLTQEWLDLLVSVGAEAPERPGANARLECLVTGGPDGDITLHFVVDDGRLTRAALGPDPDGPPVTLVATYDDAVAIARGELDPNVGFMQGRIKVRGDMSHLFVLLPLAQDDGAVPLFSRVAAETEL